MAGKIDTESLKQILKFNPDTGTPILEPLIKMWNKIDPTAYVWHDHMFKELFYLLHDIAYDKKPRSFNYKANTEFAAGIFLAHYFITIKTVEPRQNQNLSYRELIQTEVGL